MFGFLIGGEVNDDAVRLESLVGRICSTYLPLNSSDLISRIESEFSPHERNISDDSVSIMFSEMSMFVFHIYLKGTFAGEFQCIGQGKYAGFALHWATGRKTVSVMDGISYSATGGAKKLAELMAKKFGYINIAKFMREMSRF